MSDVGRHGRSRHFERTSDAEHHGRHMDPREQRVGFLIAYAANCRNALYWGSGSFGVLVEDWDLCMVRCMPGPLAPAAARCTDQHDIADCRCTDRAGNF